ncbi:hypothetical protein BaRGS_00024865 [Batillaria attramentaria]|uniref:Uncharacterized protein n=1 Tax=Batillaria attramentaria TaxID=370345 RepID=A0ABD0KAH7_9CAEN
MHVFTPSHHEKPVSQKTESQVFKCPECLLTAQPYSFQLSVKSARQISQDDNGMAAANTIELAFGGWGNRGVMEDAARVVTFSCVVGKSRGFLASENNANTCVSLKQIAQHCQDAEIRISGCN